MRLALKIKLAKALLLATILSFAMTPSVAFAAPVLVWAGMSLAAAEIAVVVIQIGVAIAVSVYGSAQARKAASAAAAKARSDYNAGLQDRTITRVTSEAPYRYIYGSAKVGSDIVAIFSSGDKDQYKHIVCVHAAHECNAITQVYVAGKELGILDGNGDVTSGDYFSSRTESATEKFTTTSFTLAQTPVAGTVKVLLKSTLAFRDGGPYGGYNDYTSVATIVGKSVTIPGVVGTFSVTYQYAVGTSRVRVKKHLGTASDPADASLLAEVGGKWAPTSVLRGRCYTVIRLDLNQPEFQGGIPSIEVLIDGKKLYDVRSGVTQWSKNPALVVYDYLTSEICGVPASDLPVAQYITAANVCDEAFWYGNKYTVNGTVTSDQTQSKVLELLAQSMAGGIISTTWDIYAGKYIAPVLALSQSDIVGAVAITPGMSDADLYNGIRGQYVSPETLYVSTDYTPYQNATYVATDTRELWQNIDFQFTDSLQRVQNLCRIFTEDQRNGFTLKTTFSFKAWGLKVGQRVTFTSAFFGQTSKIYRITDKSYAPDSAVELTLKEDAASIWDYADATVADSTPNTNLANPFAISRLAYITCQSGTNILLLQSDGTVVSRILVTWPAATTQAVLTNGVIEIEYQAVGDAIWQKTSVTGSEVQAYLLPVNDGTFYTIRARCVNPYVNVKSDWAYATHQVIGKTAPPTDIPWFNIEGNTLAWGVVTDIDLAGYVIRYHYGLNRSWGDAHPLHTGILTQSPYTPDNLPQGQITLMLAAIDTTGNFSANNAVIQTNFGNVLVANVVETFDFKAAGYTGTLTGCTVSGGNVIATSIANFYGTDTSNFYSQYDTNVFYNDYFGAMSYETLPITPSKAAVGSNLTLNTLLTGDTLFIEYRVSGSNPMYSAVGTEVFYGLDTAPFYGADPDYQSWPGQIVAKNLQYQFRFSAGQSINQGTLNTCNATIDVPDLMERFNNIVISAVGTRLPITKSYYNLSNVQLTLEADGGSAFKPVIMDKNATLGPLIYCYNSAGTQVSGTVDAVVQGY